MRWGEGDQWRRTNLLPGSLRTLNTKLKESLGKEEEEEPAKATGGHRRRGPKGIPVWGSSSEYLSSIIIPSLSLFSLFCQSFPIQPCASRVNKNFEHPAPKRSFFFFSFFKFVWFFFLSLSVRCATGVRFSVFPYGHFPFKQPMVNILRKG